MMARAFIGEDFNEYQDSFADIVQLLRCTGIRRTSLIRATDPLVTQATMVVQSDDQIPWYHIDLAFWIGFPFRRREHQRTLSDFAAWFGSRCSLYFEHYCFDFHHQARILEPARHLGKIAHLAVVPAILVHVVR